MSCIIRVNKPILSEVDWEPFFAKYEIYLITNKGYASYANSFIDRSAAEKNILAMKYAAYNGKESRCYCLCKKDSSNALMLHNQVILGSAEEKTLDIHRICSQYDISSTDFIGLLLNGVNQDTLPETKTNNTSASLYRIIPNAGGTKNEVVCLEIIYTKEGYLTAAVRTFSNNNAHIQYSDNGRHKSFDEYTHYVIDPEVWKIRRVTKEDTDKSKWYILRAEYGQSKRNNVRFLSLQDPSHYELSKIGAIHEAVQSFNRLYDGIVQIIGWESIKDAEYIHTKSLEQIKRTFLEQLPIRLPCIALCDQCNNETFYNEVKKQLAVYGYTNENQTLIELPAEMKGIMPGIDILPHDREWYREHTEFKDPYSVCVQPVQHIVSENPAYWKTRKDSISKKINLHQAVVLSLLIGLMIKDDITDGKIKSYDWNSAHIFHGPWVFYKSFFREKKTDDKTKYIFDHYIRLEITKDGKIKASNLRSIPISEGERLDHFMKRWETARIIECAIKDDEGNYMTIRRTDIVTIPENLDALSERIKDITQKKAIRKQKEGPDGAPILNKKGKPVFERLNEGLSNEDARAELFGSMLDIGYAKDGTSYMYFVGPIGRGMNNKNGGPFVRAAHIRRVMPADENLDCTDGFVRLLPTFVNIIARTGQQLSVLPFPVKYINEFEDMCSHNVT